MNATLDADAAKSCPPFLACGFRVKVWLVTLAAIQIVLYLLLAALSFRCDYHSAGMNRPLLSVFAILAGLFVSYLASIPLALRLPRSTRWISFLFIVAIIFRGIMLFSEPIQEVDIYRYIWDGTVADQGISPYRFSPAQVLQETEACGEALIRPPCTAARRNNRGRGLSEGENNLARSSASYAEASSRSLAELANQHPGLHEVLRRVHYGELPTVYPPVSQWVFRLTHRITPTQASIVTRVRVTKGVITLFDVAVMLLLFFLLKLSAVNTSWCIAYGWSPLVIKEFANSGHLDAIAVFFVVASIVCLAFACQAIGSKRTNMLAVASGTLMGLGVGAKLFPIVLFPLGTVLVARKLGRLRSFNWLASAGVVAALTLSPMLLLQRKPLTTETADQLAGLKTFLRRWEMNDLIFMIVEENIRPEGTVEGQPPLWFAVTPDAWRTHLTQVAAAKLRIDKERTPFVLTRIVTVIAFCAAALFLCRMSWLDPSRFPEAAFLTLACFWFLSPTQNPWYWTWALPLVPFARNRLWLLVSGLTLIYYARFWFQYHGTATETWGLPYRGEQIFDFIIVWFEFAPFLLLLLASRRRAGKNDHSAKNGHGLCVWA